MAGQRVRADELAGLSAEGVQDLLRERGLEHVLAGSDTDPKQHSSTEGMTPEQVTEALEEGTLDEYLTSPRSRRRV